MIASMLYWLITVLLCLLSALSVLGDGNDWVNINYVVAEAKQASASGSTTSQAISAIVRGADVLSKKGPWSVTNGKGVLPPSNDARDYLSWAPYHWPDCNWCSKTGRSQLAHTRNGSDPNVTPTSAEGDLRPSDGFDDDDRPYEESVDFRKRSLDDLTLLHHGGRLIMQHRHDKRLVQGVLNLLDLPTSLPSAVNSVPTIPVSRPAASLTTSTTTTSALKSSTSRAPAQAAAKTTKAKCSPSPTTSMAPSATWTTCPYIGRDGKVNPDVRTLSGPGAINSVGQFVLYACISSAADKSSKQAKAAVNAIDTFFLSASTGMYPNIQYGQMVRGPGPKGISGTFTGILDLRGLVKVLNGILILKGLGHSSWTSRRDSAMQAWISQYSQWLTTSDIGKKAGSRPNNHGTFYVSQAVATKVYQGSTQEAIAILLQFFKREFADQIAASGEQPFEAIRTRPYHYRCFNLEALITNAKLGDQLGLDLWSSTSKYGATIQTAMDFVIATDPRNEKVDQAIPHVAAIAAAYGDPTGKYADFLKKNMKNYKTKPFWFYDQDKALTGAHSKKTIKRDESTKSPTIPFTCPDVFKNVTSVEIDNGVFVTCEQLRPLYEAPFPNV